MIKNADDDSSEWKCDNCNEIFELDEEDDIKLGNIGEVKIQCPFCNKDTICEYD